MVYTYQLIVVAELDHVPRCSATTNLEIKRDGFFRKSKPKVHEQRNVPISPESVCSWCIGYNSSSLYFIDDNTMVYSSGNSLTFLRTTGEIVCSTPSHGSGVGPIAVSKEAQMLAYSESTLRPRIFLTKYPGNSIECTLKG